MIERDKKRAKMVKKYAAKRAEIKKQLKDKELPMDERLQLMMKLDDMPDSSSKVRMRNRCSLTGRPRGYFRKVSLSRIALRDLASKGQLPGVVKSSW